MPYLLVGLLIAGGMWWWTHRVPPTSLLIVGGTVTLTPLPGQSFKAVLPQGAQFAPSAFGGSGLSPWGGFSVSSADAGSVTFAYSSGGGAMQIQWVDATGVPQTTIYMTAVP